MEPIIVGIRFQKVGKIYHFDASKVDELKVGDFAVVETSRGQQLGEVAQVVAEPSPPPEGTWKPILRRATARDLALRQLLQKKELEATINCRAKLSETGPAGVKIVTSEYTFDGSRLSFLYSADEENKVDLRRLRAAMQRLYPRAIVEMRQIGPRDVAKHLGGMGACGLANRCCSMFLTEFSPVSIKMAKEQGISLSPSEITGMCGRLRCCLVYEYEQYVEARKGMPKRNKRVVTPAGPGKVLDVYPLKQAVLVELEQGPRQEFLHADVQPYEEWEALRKKAQEPCDKHEGGECDCGKDRPQAEAAAAPSAPRAAPSQPRPDYSRPRPPKTGPQGGGMREGGGQSQGARGEAPRAPGAGQGAAQGTGQGPAPAGTGQSRQQPDRQHGKSRQDHYKRSQNKQGKPQGQQKGGPAQPGQPQSGQAQSGQPQKQQNRRPPSKKSKRRGPPSGPPRPENQS